MLVYPLPATRVLDLSASVAGAAASRMLADLGAEVIAVERPGALREAMVQYGRNKHGIALDLGSDAGRELALRLAGQCVAVLRDEDDADLSGLDYAAFKERRSDIVLVIIGEGSARPGLGNVAAAAVMTGLFNVRFRGEGQEVRVGLAAATASMRSLAVVAASAAVLDATPDLPPSGCYGCNDGVVAVVVRTFDELAALGEVLGSPEDVDLVSGGEELREPLEAWCAGQAAHAAAATLREAGIAAQPLLTAADLPEDPHLRARGFLEPVAAGSSVTEMEGPRFRFSATPVHVRLPAPAFGEHTAAVLGDVLGLSDEEIGALVESGVAMVSSAGRQ
jgi:formyl-CoA transferase